MKRVVLSWSSGKDSAWALGVLRADPEVEVVGLLTTVNKTHGRVAMHAVREELLHLQVAAVGLPLDAIGLPWPCPNGTYEELMEAAVARLVALGATHMAFGDLFLEDIRVYREERLCGTGLEPLFPLWGRDTTELAREMTDPEKGLEAYLTCVDPEQLSPDFVGRRYDRALLAELPESVDPCGENGEFHSFVTRAPAFQEAVAVTPGEVVERGGFWFADLAPR
jgi:uncharacterized protein (TIGR00290 family)